MRFEFTEEMELIKKKIEPYMKIDGTNVSIVSTAPQWVYDENEKLKKLVNEYLED